MSRLILVRLGGELHKAFTLGDDVELGNVTRYEVS